MLGRRLRSTLQRWFSSLSSIGVPTTSIPDAFGGSQAILVRILESDLPPVRPAGSTTEQLRFLLEHEPAHPGLQKQWLLNRIADPQQRQDLIQLLEQHGQSWQERPFEPHVYASCWTDIGAVPTDRHPWSHAFENLSSDSQSQVLDYLARCKSLYLFDANAAANQALRQASSHASWVFTADSSCFLTSEAWKVIRPLLTLSDLAYLVVPTSVLAERQQLLKHHDEPQLAGDAMPLLGLACPCSEPFTPGLRRAAGADIDLLLRLGLAGPWTSLHSVIAPWEGADITRLSDRAQLVHAGWAYRLPPHSPADPCQQRDAIRLLARRTDMRLIGEALQRHPLRCWIGLPAADAPTLGLAAIAANARTVRPLSVTDKPEALPGTPERSYVNAVPHWQSFAGSEGSINRSSLLLYDTPLGGDVAQHYDRPRLQLMIDCVCALALDGYLNRNDASSDHAHRLVRAWFIDPATAMIPDGAYARLSAVDPNGNVLDAAIDFRDFYPLLDAIGLLQRSGRFSTAETQQLDQWFDAFLAWLAADSASFLQDHSSSSACTYYHLLMLAIAAFRGRRNVAAQVFDNLPGLLAAQFRSDGSPSAVAPGCILQHEHLFNLQAWASLVVLSSALGRDLLAFIDSNGTGLAPAFAYAGAHLPSDPAGHNLAAADWFAAMHVISHPAPKVPIPALPPLPEVSTGLPPFWRLCRPALSV